MSQKKIFITTAIDYASGSPHIGHAYEKLGGDILARWNRNLKNEVFFLCGTDEHGAKILQTANEKKIEVKKFVDEKSLEFKKLLEKLNISNDFFIRTTNPKHKKIVQKMLEKSFEKKDIYLGKYKGLYCVGCEKYVDLEDLENKNICKIHKKKCEEIEEENYFFKLSKYKKKLLDFYKKNIDFVCPKTRRNEILKKIEEKVCDISISRKKSSLNWGIEFPFDKEHITYVWFDALFNYYSAPNFLDGKKSFWPCDIHIVGKDISFFHAVYWPCFLMSCEIEISKKIFVHGMILDEKGHKMSKSLGNVVDVNNQIEKFGSDEIRYFLMSLGGFGEDVFYSEENFILKINKDLNDNLGNLISRVSTMIEKYFNLEIAEVESFSKEDKIFLEDLKFFSEFDFFLQNLEYNKALVLLFSKIHKCNTYINLVEPWKIKDKKRLGSVLNILASSVVLFANYLNCFMPQKSKQILEQYNFYDEIYFDFKLLKFGHKINKKENIFKKFLEEKKEVFSFSNLNLKVGKILEVMDHKNSDNLYIKKIAVGEEQPRQIISGMKKYFKKDDLVGKKVIVVCNLKPAKFRGEKSFGMILMAENEKNEIGFLESEECVGTNLTCGDKVANSKLEITINDFFKLKIKSLKDKVVCENFEIKANKKNITVQNNILGEVR